MKKKFLALLLTNLCIISTLLTVFTLPTHALYSNEEEKTPSGIALSDLEETIDNYVSNYIGQTAPGAAIAVVKDGKIIFSKGYGYSDLENHIGVDPKNTVFEWGSISKLFTWTSVMQLVEDGKLDLDENISVYLPKDFYSKLNLNQTITMRDIMNHSAGFGDYAFNTIAFSSDELVSLEEAILRDKPSQYYKVGSASAYSNYATSIAGFIVENISNQKYEDYQRNNIFHKLDMNMTTAYTDFTDNKNLIYLKSKGYLSEQNGEFHLSNWSYISHRPAGSINGTVEDLAKYAIALTPEDTISSPLFKKDETLGLMFSPSYDTSGEFVGSYHGFFDYIGEYDTYGHGGNTASFSSQFAVVPDERFGLVILTNAKYETNILFGLHDLLLGKKDSSINTSNTILPSSENVVGKYVAMQRQEGNFLDFIKYISLYDIKTTSTNEITLSLASYKAVYKQTKPYYYELINDNNPIFRNAFAILKFKMEDDKVTNVIVGHGMDLSALSKSRSIAALIYDSSILILAIVFFLTSPLVIFVLWKKNRKNQQTIQNKNFYKYHLALLILGIVTIINNIIPTAMIMINNFRNFSELRIYILLNYPLLLSSIVLLALSYKKMRKSSIARMCKVYYTITAIMLISLFELLITWNFFII